MAESATTVAPRPRRWRIVLGIGLLLAAVGLGAWYGWLRPTRTLPLPDPRRSYDGPFQNVHPEIGYVSDASCAECHPDQARTYAQHPMGRSLWLGPQAERLLSDQKRGNPFDALGSRFTVIEDGPRVRHRRERLDQEGKPVATLDFDVFATIGSGTRGYSYLTNRDGYLFLTPISWYSQRGVWDLSPGFSQAQLTGRLIVPECLYCHANRALPRDGTLNRYHEPIFEGHAIGCQRCHGPGERHVAQHPGETRVSEKMDPTIVNPRHLDRPLREAVCEQCHLQGEFRVTRRGRLMDEFRPGLAPEEFWSVYLRTTDGGPRRKAVGHVEQMYESRCFQATSGPKALGCVSCHDPHEAVAAARRIPHYRERCLRCHEDRGCRLPEAERRRESAEDSCIQCHMPRYGASDVPHTAITNHRIPRDGRVAARADERTASREQLPIRSFYADLGRTRDHEDERDLGIGLANALLGGELASPRALARAKPLLEAAVRRDDRDLSAAENWGYTLSLDGEWAKALGVFESILHQAPERELALVGAASAAIELDRVEEARGYCRRALATNPWAPEYRRTFARLLLKAEAWEEATPLCQEWVRQDPMNGEARGAWLTCLVATGRLDEARAEYARIEALEPLNLRELRARFGRKLKS